METITLTAVDPEALQNELVAAGLKQSIVRTRSGIDPQTIILALGGGVGLAEIIKSVGVALKSYYDGRTSLARAEKDAVTIAAKGLSLECTGANVQSIVQRILDSTEDR